jgi:hypothetical protein
MFIYNKLVMIDLNSIEYRNIVKLFIVLLIVVMATINKPNYHSFFNSQLTKSVVLVFIMVALYYDMHIGLLLLTLYIIVLVQLNHSVIEEAQVKVEAFKIASGCNFGEQSIGEKQMEEMSDDIIDYTLDDKVRPYEVFIKMMTNQEHLDMASNAAYL